MCFRHVTPTSLLPALSLPRQYLILTTLPPQQPTSLGRPTMIMAPSCNHEILYCVHMTSWPKMCQQDTWTSRRLSIECRDYERSLELIRARINEHQPEIFSDNETEVDMEEAEDYMNNLPSPKQHMSCLWTPEYQARRQARKRLWSPPLTPPMAGMPSYSLQPSQRLPTPTRRRQPHPARRQPSASRTHPPPSPPHLSHHPQLHLPPKAQHSKIRKARPPPRLHRPITRSMKPTNLLSLHNRKGRLEVWSATGLPHSTTFQECLDIVAWFVLPTLYSFLPLCYKEILQT